MNAMRSSFRLAAISLVLMISLPLCAGASAQTPRVSLIDYLPRQNGVLAERFCPVHELAMHVEVVKIRYGLIKLYSGDDPYQQVLQRYFAAKEELFPETHHWASGGCVVARETGAEVYFCESCRKAEVEWHKLHPGVRPEDLFP
jgi:hypothetical protein